MPWNPKWNKPPALWLMTDEDQDAALVLAVAVLVVAGIIYGVLAVVGVV